MSDPYAKITPNAYTPEQVASLPQTETVFDRPVMNIDSHEWLQSGYMISDNCQPQRADCVNVGIPIPSGKLLVKKGGHYDLVDEQRS